MTPELQAQMAADLELAKNMSSIQDLDQLVELESSLIDHMSFVNEKANELEYKSIQMKEKGKTIKEYVRTLHSRRTELSISESLRKKGEAQR